MAYLEEWEHFYWYYMKKKTFEKPWPYFLAKSESVFESTTTFICWTKLNWRCFYLTFIQKLHGLEFSSIDESLMKVQNCHWNKNKNKENGKKFLIFEHTKLLKWIRGAEKNYFTDSFTWMNVFTTVYCIFAIQYTLVKLFVSERGVGIHKYSFRRYAYVYKSAHGFSAKPDTHTKNPMISETKSIVSICFSLENLLNSYLLSLT